MRLVPGEEFGRYRVEAEIGRGGQAVVYRATQLDLDRPVALKVFDEGYLGRNGALERFRREAVAAGRLEHPRLVPVYDAGEVGGRAFMSMRLVAGDSLAERIARSGPLGAAEALATLDDVADALDFAHARGAVHRDVKPANILLDPDGAAYLSDFGATRAVREPHAHLADDASRRSVSLDHSVWFHRPVDASGWLLSELTPMASGRGRGLAVGTIRTEDGHLVATVAQEVMLRERS